MILELASEPGAVVCVPLLAAIVLAFIRSGPVAAWVNIAAASMTFLLACRLPWLQGGGELLLVDPLSSHMSILTAFVAMTTSWFSRSYVAEEFAEGRLDAWRLRQYHALYQALVGFMLLALLSNNLGVTWVAIEAATIATVIIIGLPRTAEAVEASWKFFILCGVGIALAFFGTMVLYLAALPALPPGLGPMSWNALAGAASRCKGTMLNLAFVFLLIGYGTKAGLAPLHLWMPDAHAEGPTPVSAVLSSSLLNVAMTVILRVRNLLAANADAIDPGPPIMALGLASVLLAAFSLWRRRDVKRFFAFSTIEQSGVTAFAIGLGGAGATFAAILHLTLHTLAKAALFHCVGRASQLKGGQTFTDIAGLARTHRMLGLTLAAAIVAVAGLPPFGLFSSEFLVVLATIRQIPLLAVPLGLGLVVGGWALGMRLIGLCFGPASPDHGPAPGWAALAPAWLHLALVIGLGLAMPAAMVAWFALVAATP